MDIEFLLPQMPEKGPPLPLGLGLKWPWVKSGNPAGNPYPIVIGKELVEVDSELEKLAEAKKSELIAKGASPVLAEKAVGWACNYAASFAREIGKENTEAGKIAFKRLFIYALGKSNQFAAGIKDFLNS